MAGRKETRSISELVADTANRKRRAAQARFAGTTPGQESPRDVYLAACASIGAYLGESYGFKYLKSGPHARRRSGDFTFQISFQSDRNNIADERIGLWIHGNVLHGEDYIAGGQIGNLQKDHCWLDWELADASKRDDVIRDSIRAIEELALPYFAKFEDLPSLFTLLVNEDFPATNIDSLIGFLVRFADPSTARMAAVNFLRRRPEIQEAYRRELQRYAECDLDSRRPGKYAERLAYVSHACQLGDLTAAPADPNG
jgi:hypothetical protein